MAYLYFNNAHPILYGDYVEPTRRYSIGSDSVILFIEEVIDYSLRQHNLPQWIPPVNLDFARLMNGIRYFNPTFAATVIGPDIEQQAVQLANTHRFNENVWLEFNNHEAARRYLEGHISYIYYRTNPFLFQIFSFACYASRIALENDRHSLIKDVVWALNAVLREILPNVGYFREPYFVANVYNSQHIDNHAHDIDEGIVDDDIRLNLRFLDSILLFVVELINYSLRDVDYDWTPCIDLENLRNIEMSYFTRNLGRAITHAVIETEAVHFAEGWSFNEERWLGLSSSSEAREFQKYFLQKLFNRSDAFLMLSFACYCSKSAMRMNRNSLVNEVVSALVHILRAYFPSRQHYRNLDDLATEYNNLHIHAINDDEGFENGENENDDPEENNGD